MMSIKQAAAHATVSESIIRAWVASGGLPHYRLGKPGARGKIAIKLEDLEAFLAGRRVENIPPAPKVKKPKVAFRHLRVS